MTVSNRLHLTDVEWGVLISFFKLAPPRLVAESLFTWTKGIEGSKLLMEEVQIDAKIDGSREKEIYYWVRFYEQHPGEITP